MGKIKYLSPNLISKIAAGEVIERPAYAVKELIENSLDAGATYLKIDIEEGGLRKILVVDNGEGMDEEDLKICCIPHTTSKITQDSLQAIPTLGFRGEALASLTAASEIKIISRKEENPLGSLIEILGSDIKTFRPIGAPVGTQVFITNLFESLPARKKFLKTLRTEYRHIVDIVTQYALSYPGVGFEFSHNKKLVFHLAKHQSVPERIKILLGLSLYENLIPFEFEESYIKLNGFLSKPQLTTTSLQKQFIFVNKRRITDTAISSQVKEAYGSLLDPHSHPVFLLFITLPKEFVDVNVHPRKEQIAFTDLGNIMSVIQKAVKKTLSDHNLTFSAPVWKVAEMTGSTSSYGAQLLREEVFSLLNNCVADSTINISDTLQIHNLYIVAQTKQGLAIFDQHAVAERILFEKFTRAFQNKKKETFVLKKPILFELNYSDSQALLEKLETFEELGFIITHFGQTTFKIESAPILFKDWDIVSILKETLEDLLEEKLPKDIDTRSNKMLQYLACRSAIKAGDKLTKQQMKDLLNDLDNKSYTCPHGRPLKIEMQLAQLHRLFKRK